MGKYTSHSKTFVSNEDPNNRCQASPINLHCLHHMDPAAAASAEPVEALPVGDSILDTRREEEEGMDEEQAVWWAMMQREVEVSMGGCSSSSRRWTRKRRQLKWVTLHHFHHNATTGATPVVRVGRIVGHAPAHAACAHLHRRQRHKSCRSCPSWQASARRSRRPLHGSPS
jgi:hypothetical protein